ncbi:MAG: hypothetical protein GY790_13665 [Bacteroidetes bacterium]|nr:hypothetical protein [Bacteroidota bacterium]
MPKKLNIPHTYVIVSAFILMAAMLTWILPGGEFERETVDVNGTPREVIVEGSYHTAEKAPQTWQVFSALFDGIEEMRDILSAAVVVGLAGGILVILEDGKMGTSLHGYTGLPGLAAAHPHCDYGSERFLTNGKRCLFLQSVWHTGCG